MAFYTGGLRLLLFTNLVLVTVIKEEGGGGRRRRRGKRTLFLECQERKTDYMRSGRGGHRKEGRGEKGEGSVFASVGKRASLRVSFRSGNSLFGLGVL